VYVVTDACMASQLVSIEASDAAPRGTASGQHVAGLP